jgi:hypothetical protein
MALPVLELPAWMDADVSRERRSAAVGAAALGYLHVRLRDDHLDEGDGGAEALLTADALMVHHLALLETAAASRPGVREAATRWWGAYVEAMLLEHALQRQEVPWTAQTHAAALDRSMPLLLPPLALMADPKAGEEALVALIRDLVAAHQLVNDLVDVERDLRAGNHTWVLHRAGAVEGEGHARRELFVNGLLDTLCEEALGGFGRVAEGADGLGLGALVPWVTARCGHLEETRQQAFRAFFASMLGG